MMNFRKHFAVFSTGVFAVMLVVTSTNFAWADAQSDAQAQCVEKLGRGAVAEEELDFGEVSYVCNCLAPYKWNESNTRCVSASGQTTEAPEVTPQADPEKREPSIQPKRSAEELFGLGAQAYNRKHHAQAVLWFRKAANLRNSSAMYYLGHASYFGQGVNKDYREALRWYHKAAEMGDASAMLKIGLMNLNGRGTVQSDVKAVTWYRKAVDKGQSTAMHNLAGMLDDGRGIARDRRRAAELMFKALQGGNKHSINLMTNAPNKTSKQFRRELQKIMRSEGVYDGRIDGSFGPGTKRAIRKLAGQ